MELRYRSEGFKIGRALTNPIALIIAVRPLRPLEWFRWGDFATSQRPMSRGKPRQPLRWLGLPLQTIAAQNCGEGCGWQCSMIRMLHRQPKIVLPELLLNFLAIIFK